MEEPRLTEHAAVMRRSARRGIAVALLVFASLVIVTPGWAAEGDRITDYRIEYTLDADGTLHGREHITYAFAPGERRGIFVSWGVRDDVDDERYRLYDLEVDSVTSPTGAPADYDTNQEGAYLVAQIGDEEQTVTGEQEYVIDYTVRGAVNRIAGEGDAPDTQELYLDAVAPNWEADVERATVTVEAPQPAQASRCFVDTPGGGDESRCSITRSEDTLTYASTDIRDGEAMTVVAAYPDGTVANDQPILVEGNAADGPTLDEYLSDGAQNGLAAGSLAVGALALIGTGVGVQRAYRRRGRDKRFAGVAPGVMPGDDAAGATVHVTRAAPVAVRFEPPEEGRPGLIGTLQDERADNVDVTATVLDLAVRGHLRIEEIDGGDDGNGDWALVRSEPTDPAPLLLYETKMLDALLGDEQRTHLSSRRSEIAGEFGTVQAGMYEEVVAHGWFEDNPATVRNKWALGALGLIVLGVVALFPVLIASTSAAMPWGQVLMFAAAGLGLLLAGVITWFVGNRMPVRTARGTAVLEQAKGFKQYLVTAEAHQIRFEEAEQVFSRYLPYAVVFGVTERWVEVFDSVAESARAAGYAVDVPAWYLMSGTWNHLAFAGALSGFAQGTEVAFTAPADGGGGSAGSSGASGFGGGGFAGGGGFGGGGGGSW